MFDEARICDFFADWVATHGSSGPTGRIAASLAAGELDSAPLDAIASQHGVGRDHWFRGQILDLLLDYVRQRLSAGRLTFEDVVDVRVLRGALAIRDGELYSARASELSELLQAAFDDALDDALLDEPEEAFLVNIQAALDLSYDQFLVLSRPALERARTDLNLRIARASARDVGSLREKLAALEPIVRLAEQHARTIGALY
jgi:hypothetical protein